METKLMPEECESVIPAYTTLPPQTYKGFKKMQTMLVQKTRAAYGQKIKI